MLARVIVLDDYRRTPSPLQIRAAVEAEEEARLREYHRQVEALRARAKEVRADGRGMYWVGEER